MKILLASNSPRRKELLSKTGTVFEVASPNCDETLDNDTFSYKKIETLALKKALSLNNNKDIIIGADTVVISDNKILTKPKNRQDALNMLSQLNDTEHFVVTAVAVVYKEHNLTSSDTTFVTFNNISYQDRIAYIDTFKPFDKAGAYGIQELPDFFIKNVNGNLDNVIGLPTKLVLEMLCTIKKI